VVSVQCEVGACGFFLMGTLSPWSSGQMGLAPLASGCGEASAYGFWMMGALNL